MCASFYLVSDTMFARCFFFAQINKMLHEYYNSLSCHVILLICVQPSLIRFNLISVLFVEMTSHVSFLIFLMQTVKQVQPLSDVGRQSEMRFLPGTKKNTELIDSLA